MKTNKILITLSVLLVLCICPKIYAATIEADTFLAADYIVCPNGRLASKKCPPEIVIPVATLLDWNTGSGLTWPTGWVYDANASLFGDPGWYWSDPAGIWGTPVMSGSYSLPISFGKSSVAVATIDTAERAPSTATGGSLYVTESGAGQQADWWIWQGGKTMGDYGLTDSTTDRMSFYLKTEGMDLTDPADPVRQNIHIGTYLCWSAYCPDEGPNQHYYHWLAIGMNDAWIHVQIDQHPQHQRGRTSSNPQIENNPAFTAYGEHYFDSLHQIYVALEGSPQDGTTAFFVDEFRFFNQPQPENEESITSLWVGYSAANDWWEIGFMSRNYLPAEDGTALSTYAIRYSTSPITNENWNSATPINEMYFGDATHTSNHAQAGVIRKVSGWRGRVWTRFQLDNGIESGNDKLYFAVKDISVAGAGAGTGDDWLLNDFQNAPSANVKTIDYSLRTGG